MSISSQSVFLFLLTLSVYGVEFSLEFSSNSVVENESAPGRVNVINATQHTCTLTDVTYRNTPYNMARLADECIDVDYEENKYIFYRYVWEKGESDEAQLLCIRSQDNVLIKDSLVYKPQNLDPPAEDLIDAIRAGSFGANGDINQAVITIQVLSEHVLSSRTYVRFGIEYASGLFATPLPITQNTSVVCFGNVYGRLGENQMKAQVLFCLEGMMPFSSDTRFIFLQGSGLITEDATDMRSKLWNANVACLHGRVLGRFAEGITRDEFLSSETYAAFLGWTFNRDDRSLQKYAALYKNCENVRVPTGISETHNQTIPNAKALPIVHILVQEWSVALFLTWSIALTVLSSVLTCLGNRRNMPDSVFGEQSLAHRWLHEKKSSSSDIESGQSTNHTSKPDRYKWIRWCVMPERQLYLSVKDGELADAVTVTSIDVTEPRDVSKPFEEIGSR